MAIVPPDFNNPFVTTLVKLNHVNIAQITDMKIYKREDANPAFAKIQGTFKNRIVPSTEEMQGM